MSARRFAPVLAALLVLAACSGGSSTPMASTTAGPLDLVLSSPNADDGALLIEVSGAPVDSVTAASGYVVYAGAPGGAARRIIVQGTIAAGPVARIWVPDATASAAYHATVLQAAARGTYAQRALGGYGIAVR